MVEKILQAAEEGLDASLARLFELLRIPSVSTDPDFSGSCRAAGQWCADALTGIGFSASLRDTHGHPMVVAHGGRDAGEGAPHLLFYGHYDVQPPDPLEEWRSPPFEPQLEENGSGGKRIVARGASDDKGQLMTFVEAARAWVSAQGGLPVRVTVLLEGEEECGSPSLEPFLEANADELRADVALVCDTAMWNAKTPAITSMLRGLMLEEVVITAADRDLHSGMFGGPARNPIHVLTTILAGLHDAEGRVQLPGFYEGVGELPDEVRAQWNALEKDKTGFLKEIGLEHLAGEKGRTMLEQLWSRPTCDVNGIIGGYTGQGTKTVIPSKASAKVSFRLVGTQDPAVIAETFRDFVRQRLPEDCTVEFIRHGGDPAISFALNGAYFEAAKKGLSDEFGREAALIGCGGSIPIVGSFKKRLGLDSLLIGFALDDDRIHSPNEKYDIASFRHGIRSWVRILGEMGALARG